MKSWQMFLVGVVALLALFFLPNYVQTVAGIAALAIIAAVAFGFLVRPRRDIFIVRTKTGVHSPDDVSIEHNCLAVRLELARLWLLFIPTFLATSFLVVTATKGTLWNFPLVDRYWDISPYVVIPFRVLVLVVWGVVSTWVTERWALRSADTACSAKSVSLNGEYVWYSFIDNHGEYYGGSDLPFGFLHTAELGRIVFYNEGNPEMNKLALACLFHRLAVIGHGVVELDEASVSAHMRPALAQPPHSG